jgi:hypothetical protein
MITAMGWRRLSNGRKWQCRRSRPAQSQSPFRDPLASGVQIAAGVLSVNAQYLLGTAVLWCSHGPIVPNCAKNSLYCRFERRARVVSGEFDLQRGHAQIW